MQTVLPAHGHPFADLAGRTESIKAHHEERLDKLREVSAALRPVDGGELSHHLFRKERWGLDGRERDVRPPRAPAPGGPGRAPTENGKLVYDIRG